MLKIKYTLLFICSAIFTTIFFSQASEKKKDGSIYASFIEIVEKQVPETCSVTDLTNKLIDILNNDNDIGLDEFLDSYLIDVEHLTKILINTIHHQREKCVVATLKHLRSCLSAFEYAEIIVERLEDIYKFYPTTLPSIIKLLEDQKKSHDDYFEFLYADAYKYTKSEPAQTNIQTKLTPDSFEYKSIQTVLNQEMPLKSLQELIKSFENAFPNDHILYKQIQTLLHDTTLHSQELVKEFMKLTENEDFMRHASKLKLDGGVTGVMAACTSQLPFHVNTLLQLNGIEKAIQKDNNDNTALAYAIHSGKLYNMKLLLQYPGQLYSLCTKSHSPLKYAISLNKYLITQEIVRQILNSNSSESALQEIAGGFNFATTQAGISPRIVYELGKSLKIATDNHAKDVVLQKIQEIDPTAFISAETQSHISSQPKKDNNHQQSKHQRHVVPKIKNQISKNMQLLYACDEKYLQREEHDRLVQEEAKKQKELKDKVKQLHATKKNKEKNVASRRSNKDAEQQSNVTIIDSQLDKSPSKEKPVQSIQQATPPKRSKREIQQENKENALRAAANTQAIRAARQRAEQEQRDIEQRVAKDRVETKEKELFIKHTLHTLSEAHQKNDQLMDDVADAMNKDYANAPSVDDKIDQRSDITIEAESKKREEEDKVRKMEKRFADLCSRMQANFENAKEQYRQGYIPNPGLAHIFKHENETSPAHFTYDAHNITHTLSAIGEPTHFKVADMIPRQRTQLPIGSRKTTTPSLEHLWTSQ